MRFAGRRAVVTGGASGIGEAVAKRLAAEGGKVAVWDLNGGIKVDISNYESVEKAVAETISQIGGIDILVNSAGITGPTVPLIEFPIAGWKQVIDVNLVAPFLVCHAVVPEMLKRGTGRIVNIASIAGKEGNPMASHYSASKAGLIGLTKSLGKELATTGIRVNCITPAAAKTDIFHQMKPEFIAFMLSKIPMNRFVEVDEIAAMILWLSSDDCSFSTGAVFDISGGRGTY
jgi:3-oxoacyl-[acyl-carrier protein] reductase